MTEDPTPFDRAHAAMEAAPEDTGARLRAYDRLAASEVYLLLEAEPEGEQIAPRLFEVETGPVALVFDREDRLAQFVGGTAPYAALPGRTLIEMLAGQGVGLGVNLDVAPSAMLLPADALDWLAERLRTAPDEATGRPEEVFPPAGLPEAVVTGLDATLASAGGLAALAYLAGVRWDHGGQGHLLAFIDPVPGAEPALARAVQQTLSFSGLEAGSLDVVFLRASDPVAAQLARVALRFDLPEPVTSTGPAAPGLDPDSPPRLR